MLFSAQLLGSTLSPAAGFETGQIDALNGLVAHVEGRERLMCGLKQPFDIAVVLASGATVIRAMLVKTPRIM